MYGQMTAGSWIYIGTQGILQGTYETFAELARQHFGGTLRGRVVLTAGLGGMGGAQPLAVTMNEGVASSSRSTRRAPGAASRSAMSTDLTDSLDEALAWARAAAAAGRGRVDRPRRQRRRDRAGAGRRGERFDVVTDQTSAHDALNGYVPAEISLADALPPARRDAARRLRPPLDAVDGRPRPGDARLPGGRRGRLRLRQQPPRPGPGGRRRRRLRLPGLRAGLHPAAVLRGQGPVPLGRAERRPGGHPAHGSGDPRALPRRRRCGAGSRWPRSTCRSRACRRGSAGSATASGRRRAWRSTSWSRTGEVAAPIVIGRDHLDAGSVASPNRETEAMRDGSDAIADWPLLNALVNTAAGATWVTIHHGGGVGIGYSQHAGMVVVADGTELAAQKLERVLTTDPGWASSATPTPATSGRSRSPASAASGSRCSTSDPPPNRSARLAVIAPRKVHRHPRRRRSGQRSPG